MLWYEDGIWFSSFWRLIILIGVVISIVLLLILSNKYKLVKEKSEKIDVQKKELSKEKEELLAKQTEVSDLLHSQKMAEDEFIKKLNRRCGTIKNSPNFKDTIYWKDFNKMCVCLDQQLNFLPTKLRNLNILTEKEIRLCVLVVLGFNYKEIAELLPYSFTGVGKFKYLVAHKLSTNIKNMRQYLLLMAQ